MKRVLVVGCLIVGLSVASSALAAPLSWAGFYIGGNVGYSWGPWDASSNQVIYNLNSYTASPNVDGVIGGFQAGYNFQNGPWVYGLEADIQASGEKDSQTSTDPGLAQIIDLELEDFLPGPPGGGPATFTHEWKFPWFGTVRGRLGYAFNERWLLYVTGGLAYGQVKYSMTFSQPGAGRFYTLSDSDTRVGWTIGGGLETAIDNHWSVKVEYLYLDLGTRDIDTVDVDGAPFHVQYDVRDHIARVGLNYKF